MFENRSTAEDAPEQPNQAEGQVNLDARWSALGILDFEALKQASEDKEEYMTEGLFKAESLNILVGDSGLGKTALAVQLGVCVASGEPFLGHNTARNGRVLYCDSESGRNDFSKILSSVSQELRLPGPPGDFHVWNPYWSTPGKASASTAQLLRERVKAFEPLLVVVDPLRSFWPEALDKGRLTAKMIDELRKLSADIGCSWLLLHHTRKTDRNAERVSLSDGHAWFQEATGQRALINSTDTRLGVEKSPHEKADLTVAGFARIDGPIGPFDVTRDHDEDGDPLGYRLLKGPEYLNPRYRSLLENLPTKFRFKQVQDAAGMSGSSRSAFLKQCTVLGLIQKGRKGYEKVIGADALLA